MSSRARGVRKRFGDIQAVDGVDLAVAGGERVGIVGPNGAGKTTLLLMLLGAIDPDEGAVELMGRRLPGGRSVAMEDVGFAAGYLPLPDRLRSTRRCASSPTSTTVPIRPASSTGSSTSSTSATCGTRRA